MKPIAIFRHARSEGPGHFATFLERKSLPTTLIAMDDGASVPKNPRDFSGLAFMGGPMSANDDLAWIAPLLDLIRDAVRKDVPLIGHCLGGQLISKAFGGTVSVNPVKEIGWAEVSIADNGVARAWLGEIEKFTAFHWHGETFTIPPGATRLASSDGCKNQAFALGKHLGMQFHVEMTEELIRTWGQLGHAEIAASDSPAVQTPQQMEVEIGERVARLNKIADGIYDKWIAGLSKV